MQQCPRRGQVARRVDRDVDNPFHPRADHVANGAAFALRVVVRDEDGQRIAAVGDLGGQRFDQRGVVDVLDVRDDDADHPAFLQHQPPRIRVGRVSQLPCGGFYGFARFLLDKRAVIQRERYRCFRHTRRFGDVVDTNCFLCHDSNRFNNNPFILCF